MKWLQLCIGFLLPLAFPTTSFGEGILSYQQVNQLAQEPNRPDMVGVRALYQRYGFGVPQSFKAVEDGISLQNARHPFCLYNLAMVLSTRAGLVPNPMDAAKLRDQAEHLFAAAVPDMVSLATQGDPYAKLMLGGLFETGHGGIPKDLHQAAELYSAASDAGLPLATHNLGWLMIQGGVPGKSKAQGIRLLCKSAEAGVPISIYYLGNAFLNGEGVPRDIQKGIAIILNAATQHNHAQSQFALAKIYLEGKYGNFNRNEGAMFFQRAVENLCSEAVAQARKNGATLPDYSLLPQVDILLLQEYGSKMLPVYSTHPNQGGSAPIQPITSASSVSDSQPIDPEVAKLQKQYSKKSTEVIAHLAEAISDQLKSENPSIPAATLKLDPAGGKAPDWMESAFAPEILVAKQKPAFASAISSDQAFAYASLDLLQILPLVKEKKFTSADKKISDYLNPSSPVSKETLDGARTSLEGLQGLLSDPIKQSDQLRQQSATEAANKHYDQAINILNQAMKIDLRDDDPQKILDLQQNIKKNALKTEIGL